MGAAEILPQAGAAMHIYECIIPRNHLARAGLPVLATSRAGTIDYGSPSADSEVAFRCRQISKKIADFFATPTRTVPCVGMYIIHFPRAVIHQRPLLRSL